MSSDTPHIISTLNIENWTKQNHTSPIRGPPKSPVAGPSNAGVVSEAAGQCCALSDAEAQQFIDDVLANMAQENADLQEIITPRSEAPTTDAAVEVALVNGEKGETEGLKTTRRSSNMSRSPPYDGRRPSPRNRSRSPVRIAEDRIQTTIPGSKANRRSRDKVSKNDLHRHPTSRVGRDFYRRRSRNGGGTSHQRSSPARNEKGTSHGTDDELPKTDRLSGKFTNENSCSRGVVLYGELFPRWRKERSARRNVSPADGRGHTPTPQETEVIPDSAETAQSVYNHEEYDPSKANGDGDQSRKKDGRKRSDTTKISGKRHEVSPAMEPHNRPIISSADARPCKNLASDGKRDRAGLFTGEYDALMRKAKEHWEKKQAVIDRNLGVRGKPP